MGARFGPGWSRSGLSNSIIKLVIINQHERPNKSALRKGIMVYDISHKLHPWRPSLPVHSYKLVILPHVITMYAWCEGVFVWSGIYRVERVNNNGIHGWWRSRRRKRRKGYRLRMRNRNFGLRYPRKATFLAITRYSNSMVCKVCKDALTRWTFSFLNIIDLNISGSCALEESASAIIDDAS